MTATKSSGCSAAAAVIACHSRGFPAIGCNTFGTADRILVPAPAASTMTVEICGLDSPEGWLTGIGDSFCGDNCEKQHGAPPPGFEPEPSEPKSEVLPLHHGGLLRGHHPTPVADQTHYRVRAMSEVIPTRRMTRYRLMESRNHRHRGRPKRLTAC